MLSDTSLRPAQAVRFHWQSILIIVLLIVIAAGGAFWWINRAPGENSAEVTFARDMSTHHSQAVEMALIIRDRTNDAALKQFALDIILTQQAQIGQMQGWLAVWDRPLTGQTAPMNGMGEMMGMANQTQVNALQTLPVAQAEISFLQLMIRHHQGGVIMAQNMVGHTSHAEVTRLAQSIITGQQSEISYMEGLLKQRGAAPLAPVMPMDMSHN